MNGPPPWESVSVPPSPWTPSSLCTPTAPTSAAPYGVGAWGVGEYCIIPLGWDQVAPCSPTEWEASEPCSD